MRLLVPVVLSLLTLDSCKYGGPSGPAPNGVIKAQVVLVGSGAPSPGKRVTVLNTSDTLTTDTTGTVLFVLQPGTYTVRAFDIGTPGPSRPYLDSTAVVKSGDTTHVSFRDCPFCL